MNVFDAAAAKEAHKDGEREILISLKSSVDEESLAVWRRHNWIMFMIRCLSVKG